MQKRFTEEQVVELLREAEKSDRSIGEECRAHNVSESAFYRCAITTAACSSPRSSALRPGKENARLKRLLAERCLEINIIEDVLSKNC